ncbi:MAG: hypothetical protein ACFFBJ_04300 [Promethearchaeota archaeon]
MVFEIAYYTIALGPEMYANFDGVEIEAGGIIACHGKKTERLTLYFLNDDSPVPMPTAKKNIAILFLHISKMPAYVDLLRNEKPAYAVINEKKPERSYIKTTKERVGEEESP